MARGALQEPARPHPGVRRDRAGCPASRHGEQPGPALPPAAAGRTGQAAAPLGPHGAPRRAGLPCGRRPQEPRADRRDRGRLARHLLQPRPRRRPARDDRARATDRRAARSGGRRAAAATGRGVMSGFDVVATTPVVLVDDVEEAASHVRDYCALYIGGMGSREQNFYNQLACRMGFERDAERIQDLYLAGRPREAAAAVPLEFIDETALLGSPRRIAQRLRRYEEAGVTTLSIATGGGMTREQGLATLAAVAQIADWPGRPADAARGPAGSRVGGARRLPATRRDRLRHCARRAARPRDVRPSLSPAQKALPDPWQTSATSTPSSSASSKVSPSTCPVSSTGHLTITEKLLGLEVNDPAVTAYTAFIQIGAIAATLIYFFKDFVRFALAWFRGLRRRRGAARPGLRAGVGCHHRLDPRRARRLPRAGHHLGTTAQPLGGGRCARGLEHRHRRRGADAHDLRACRAAFAASTPCAPSTG